MPPLLSATLIVRDEEAHLDACLRSIREVVDEIVVVDTGSTDGTIEIARSFGARVYEVPWQGDFAAARNAALERSRGAWILYIDADERLRPCARPELEALLADPETAGLSVFLRARAHSTSYREMRLFRNDPLIRFEGVIHENIWPGIRRYMKAKGGRIGASELHLDHVGYEGDQAHKHHRNLPLLLRALEQDPTHVYRWYHLGVVYRGLGEPAKARAALSSALAHARRKAKPYPGDCAPFGVLIDMQLEAGEDPSELLEEAQRLFPDNPQLVWQEGLLRTQQRRYRDALRPFRWLIRRGARADLRFDHVGYDQRLFTMLAYGRLATCYFQLGRYADARRWFERAERADPAHLEYRIKRQLCAALARGRGNGAAPATLGEAGPRPPR